MTATIVTPQRIRLSRARGFRLADASTNPNGVVNVARPSRWGNPCTVAFAMDTGEAVDKEDARQSAVDWFNAWLTEPVRCEITDVFLDRRAWILDHVAELAGKDLACWCDDGPCHADVLLELSNGDQAVGR